MRVLYTYGYIYVEREREIDRWVGRYVVKNGHAISLLDYDQSANGFMTNHAPGNMMYSYMLLVS